MKFSSLFGCVGVAAAVLVGPSAGVALAADIGVEGSGQAGWSEVVHEGAAENFRLMGWPTGCHDEVLANRYMTGATCQNSNGGFWQAAGTCVDNSGNRTSVYGGWTNYGVSYAYCQGTSRAESSGIVTRPN